MTFKEVSEKFPLNCSVGYFYIDRRAFNIKNIKENFRPSNFNNFFFVQNGASFYQIEVMMLECLGYYTRDGKNFFAYGLDEESQMQDLLLNEKMFFIPPVKTIKEERAYIVEAWMKNHEGVPIFTEEELQQTMRYNF